MRGEVIYTREDLFVRSKLDIQTKVVVPKPMLKHDFYMFNSQIDVCI